MAERNWISFNISKKIIRTWIFGTWREKLNLFLSVVCTIEKNLDSYLSVFSDYCLYLYIHTVSANMSTSLLQVFVELWSLHGTSNCVLYLFNLRGSLQHSFFQAAVVSILLCGCTTWTLTKRLEKKLDGNYTRLLRAILNKSWWQHPTRHQLYGHLPPITKTIQVRRNRHAGHCWRSRDELISDVLLWTPTYGQANAGRPARTYIQQLCEDTGCSPEDLPEVMNDRDKWRERVRDIRASGTMWWWWWFQ